jgi:hypothetical protein
VKGLNLDMVLQAPSSESDEDEDDNMEAQEDVGPAVDDTGPAADDNMETEEDAGPAAGPPVSAAGRHGALNVGLGEAEEVDQTPPILTPATTISSQPASYV